MKKYIENNLTPLVIGFSFGVVFMALIHTIDDTVSKIVIILTNH